MVPAKAGHALQAYRKTASIERDRGRWAEFEQVYHKKPLKPDDLTTDLFCVQFWEQAVPWCLRQAEETFCDFIGVRLFRSSYLDAFSYLLCPGIVGTRSPNYPKMSNCARNLEKAGRAYFVPVPAKYADLFDDQAEPNLVQSDLFRLSVAEDAMAEMVDELIDRADREITSAGFAAPSEQELRRRPEGMRSYPAAIPPRRSRGRLPWHCGYPRRGLAGPT